MIHVVVPRDQDWAFVNYLASHGAGLVVSEGEIRRKMDELSSVAREQIRSGE